MNTTELQKEILQDTINFYNSTNLCRSKQGGYQYSATETSPGCAIGRHLTPENSAFLDTNPSFYFAEFVYENFPEKLTDKFRQAGSVFLTTLQGLHDNFDHWDKYGLTYLGVNYVKEHFSREINENITL